MTKSDPSQSVVLPAEHTPKNRRFYYYSRFTGEETQAQRESDCLKKSKALELAGTPTRQPASAPGNSV